MYPSGVVVDPSGSIVDFFSPKWNKDGSAQYTNGPLVYADGSALFPNGIKLDCDGFPVSTTSLIINAHCVANAKDPNSPD
jgi:hypothetical protein